MDEYMEKYLEKENESIVKLCNNIIDKQVDFTNELLDISMQNNLRAYDSLIEERKEALIESVNHLIDTLAINHDEEFDGTTPPKSLLEKQNDDLDKFKEELKILTQFHNASMDKSLDILPKRVINNLENIWLFLASCFFLTIMF